MSMASPIDSWVSNTDEDHGELMTIVTWTLFGIASCFLVVRYYLRHTQGKLWLDDLLLGISWVLLFSQVTINQFSINLGFGKHILDVNFTHLDRITLYGASGLTINIIATSLSKIAFGVTLIRLTTGWYRYYVYFAITTLAIFATPAAILPWVQCKPLAKAVLDIIPGECIDKKPTIHFGRFQAVWAALMDFSLALLPWKVLWKLQMRTAEKMGVCFAMSLGILAGITSILRGRYIELLTRQDLSYDAYNWQIWSTAEVSMTIVAMSIPVLRVFFRQAISNYSTPSKRTKSATNGSTPKGSAIGNLTAGSGRRSSKLPSSIVDNFSSDSRADVFGRGANDYMELDDLVVDEKTGRVTCATPDSVPDGPVQRPQEWPMRDQS